MSIERSAIAAVALSAALVTPCLADDAASAAGGDESLQEVVVTGSRLATGFDMPTPVNMYNADDLAQQSPNRIAESLAELPSLIGSQQTTTSGMGSGANANNGQDLLNLRNMGSNRTLILMDGQRMGVTNGSNGVDINIIPQSLVKRVDIVTGGASASYGSDAVAGVVNFILDNRFTGLKFDVNGGETTYHDARNGKVSLTYGTDIGSRAHFVGSAEFFKEEGQTYGQLTGRNWFDYPTGAWTNPVAGAHPTIIQGPNALSDQGSYGGTITAFVTATGPNPAAQGTSPISTAGLTGCGTNTACLGLLNQQFLPGGQLAPFVYGQNALTGGFASGGSGAIVNQPFDPDQKRASLFGHGEFDITDNITAWGQASWNRSYTLLNSQVNSQLSTSQFTIYEGNPYLPASVASILAATPGTQAFNLTRYDLDFGLEQDLGVTSVSRFAAGLKGKLNDVWSWDATGTYQYTNQTLDIKGTNEEHLYAAADAVTNPANGQIVCREALLEPQYYGNCVPADLFGNGSVSAAAANYIMGWNDASLYLKQTTADANIRGNLGDKLQLGAGPISVAAGGNFRKVTADREVDPFSDIYLPTATAPNAIQGFPSGLAGRYGGYQFYNPSPIHGEVHATEGYGEIGIPLLKGVPFAKALDADLAGRLTDYSQSGDENMWKLGLNWTVNDWVRFRGTSSMENRAPSILELFQSAQVTQGRNTVPFSTASTPIRSSGQNITTGNPALSPEKAHTYTIGTVLTPPVAQGLELSFDWYKIMLSNEIAAPSAQAVIDGCYFGNKEYCSFIQVNGSPVTTTTGITGSSFVTVTTPELNAGTLMTSGVDFDGSYTHRLPVGSLAVRANANYLLNFINPAGGCPGTNQLVGAVSNVCGDHPRITARVATNYNVGNFGVYIQERFIDHAVIDPTYISGIDITNNNVPNIFYTDLNFNYDVTKIGSGQASLYFNITNVFNRDPPVTTASSRSWIVPTEFNVYDVLGRRYLLGFRYRM